MPRTIALIYLAFGAVWIFFTDRLLVWLHLDAGLILRLQTAKGWLFVVGSAILLYVLLRRYKRRGGDALAALIESRNEMRRMNAELERRVAERTRQLEAANRELEAFAYAVSHDLRAPLRSMSGFSQILQEARRPARREIAALPATHPRRQPAHVGPDRGSAEPVAHRSQRADGAADQPEPARGRSSGRDSRALSGRDVQLEIEPGMEVNADARLLRIAMENLLSNAWKYTARTPQARVSVGAQAGEHGPVYFVRDNGVGFDMAYADKLFGPFQRLHPETEFPGHRHRPGHGATHRGAAWRAHLGRREADEARRSTSRSASA